MPLLYSIVFIILNFILGVLLSWNISKNRIKRIYSEEFKNLSNMEIAASMELQKKEGIQEYRLSGDYKNSFENEFRKGIEEGEKRAMSKLSIKYDNYERTIESLFSKKVDIGYTMQIFYDNFPIGEPTVRIMYHNEKSKEENVKYLIDKVQESILQLKSQAALRGIQVLKNEKQKKI